MSNAQMGIGQSTGALIFRMLRWALGIPPEHSDFECSDGNLAFHRSIQISNAHMGIGHFERSGGHKEFHRSIQLLNAHIGIGHSAVTFRFRMHRWPLAVPPVHSHSECSDGHCACHRST